MVNCVFGLTEEAGEVASLFKKMFFHKELDADGIQHWKELLTSELGDVEYYWLKLVDLMGLTPEEIIRYNKYKLLARMADTSFTGQAR